jgi:subtilisin family serine protease
LLHTPRTSRRWLAALTASAVVVGGATLASGSASAAAPTHHQLSTVKPGSLKQPAAGESKAPASAPLSSVPAKGRYAFLLKLDTASTQSVFSANRSTGLADAKAAASDHLSVVRNAQSAVIGRLPGNTSVLYRSHALVAGVAVYTNVKNLAALSAIKGVSKVYPIAPKSFSNSYAVPLQGAPQVWEGKGDRGENTSIAIIDTGIDYTHANFGGPGTTSAYDDALATDDVANPDFPTNKVIGGTDLVGDAYDAASPAGSPALVPHPDPNPLDCGGHGSHVAGSAAGFGENADGTTYTSGYNTSTPFDTMEIGPGMAPKAKLYAFKVFGCEGSTNVVGEALDMAADPNGDGDTSDAVDVINMSLGSDYGSSDDGDSIASDAAVDAGITVAVASGNAGDFTDVGGSPGDANKVITVANSLDASNVIDALNVSAPGAIAGSYGAERSVAYDYTTKPDLSGDVVKVAEATNPDGCAPLDAADAAAVSGNIAFVEWTDGATRRCGSAARALNLSTAGASGFIFADDAEAFSAGITGSDVIPGVLVTKSAGDAIRAQLAASQTVTVSGTTLNGFQQDFPGDNDKVNISSSRGVHAAGPTSPRWARACSPRRSAPGTAVSPSPVRRWRPRWSRASRPWSSPVTRSGRRSRSRPTS